MSTFKGFMKYIFLFLLIITNLSHAFTLTGERRGFSDNEITINFSDSDCSGTDMSMSKIKKHTKTAVEEFWNEVNTSALTLKIGSIKESIDTTNMDSIGEIIDEAKTNTIIIGCSTAVEAFSDSSGDSTSILGVGNFVCSSNNCKGGLVLNSVEGSPLASTSKSQVIATIAHEIGHAIGIGHSEYKHSLMYYKIGSKKQEWLGQDDIDAVTYLYPHDSEAAGLLGSCASISTKKQNPNQSFLWSFLIGIIAIFFFNKLFNLVTLKSK